MEKMYKNLLWEIGTEELPARFILPALKSLKDLAIKVFSENNLYYEEIKTAGTCRRLTLFVKNLSEKQEDKEEEILGPPLQIGLDKKGNYTPAAIGFAKKYGVSPSELKIKETKKGKYLCLKRTIQGKKTKHLLPDLLLNILKNIYFPKTMRWGNYSIRFARPIRWILCLFGNEVIPLKVANVKAENLSYGHRFLASFPIKFEEADWIKYEKSLEENYVIVDPQKRIEKTKTVILEICKDIGYPEIEEDLLYENANLVEYPFPILGKFPKKFLNLPEPLIITALKEHQRYFSIRDFKGNLTNYFVAINNNLVKNSSIVKKGHERVTKARLEDAKFYFERDLKTPLETKLEKLKGIIYHVKCGTLWDKTQRLVKLSEIIISDLNLKVNYEILKTACIYSKADLASEVVKEFPSLQGIIGSIYAEYFGKKEIARAIYEQYLPMPQDEKLPETPEGIVLSLADKIDHLTSMFGIGERPTGEKDPYGLRRCTYGIIKILLGKELFLQIENILNSSITILQTQGFLKNKKILSEICTFIRKRLEGELLNLEFEKNFISVVINLPLNPYDIYLRIKALKDIQNKEDFTGLVISFKRVFQILKGIDKNTLPTINVSLFQEKEEKTLYEIVENIRSELDLYYKNKKYFEYLKTLLKLREAIDRFFDNVFVMTEDKKLRLNRLKLLSEIAELFDRFGDFSSFI